MGMGLDLMAERKDGTLLPVEISLSPINFQGRACAIAVVRDVTELRRLSRELKQNNAELKRSNEDLEHFAYVASHDLQEPLRMVGGYTQLLARRYGDKLDDDAREYIHYAVDGVKRMQTLISDLLTYSRLSSRSKPFSQVDLNHIARLTLSHLEPTISEHQAVIEVDRLPEVFGDPIQLAQVLQNLLSNAIKFHQKDVPPHIHIKGQVEGRTAFLSVEDNGIGIDAAYLDKIFVIFQRLHTRDQYPGTGIGLAICKKIIERHGGTIHVTSHPGRGTTFHITLPTKEYFS
jgi:light-regulated signal transduction histidine kinase (bacteriophytochrome)